jgi:hypothetical protein
MIASATVTIVVEITGTTKAHHQDTAWRPP